MIIDPHIQLKQPYPCFVCGANAAFGFTMRTGDIWTCLDHRSDSNKRLVASGLAKPDRIVPTEGLVIPRL